MARIRTVKPDFWTDEKAVECSPCARLLFLALLNFVDDEGRITYSPKKIKLLCLPADDVSVTDLCAELRQKSLIIIYESEGKQYLQVKNFAEHQKIDKRRVSKIPAPKCADLRQSAPTFPDGMEGNGMELTTTTFADANAHDVPEKPNEPTEAEVDGEVFAFLRGAYKHVDVMKAGRILKGKGQPWTAWKLGALFFALDKDPPVDDPVTFAAKCKQGSFPEHWELLARKKLAELKQKATERHAGTTAAARP